MQLRAPHAPRLVSPPRDYRQQDFSQFVGQLSLYFTQLDFVMQQITLGFNTAGTFYSDATQATAGAGTANAVTLNNTSFGFGVDIESSSRITVDRSGVYTLNFELAVDSNGAADDFFVWLRADGANIASTATKVTVDGEGLVARSHTLQLTAGQYLQVMWSSPSATARLKATAAAPPVPALPSAAASLTYHYPGALGGY